MDSESIIYSTKKYIYKSYNKNGYKKYALNRIKKTIAYINYEPPIL